MKSFALICMFISVFIFTKAETEAEKQAFQECSALYPSITGNPLETLFVKTVGGERPNYSDNTSNCFVFCYLEKIKVVDSEGNLLVSSFLNPSSGNGLVFFNNGHIAVVSLFQISRALRHFEDKCKKATIAYIRYVETAWTLSLAETIVENERGLQDKINSALLSGEKLPEEVLDKIKRYKSRLDQLTSENLQASLDAKKKAHETSVKI